MGNPDPPPKGNCDLCKGKGTLITPLPSGRGWTEDPCPDCDGTGKKP